jgi:hypothetical protein
LGSDCLSDASLSRPFIEFTVAAEVMLLLLHRLCLVFYSSVAY